MREGNPITDWLWNVIFCLTGRMANYEILEIATYFLLIIWGCVILAWINDN